MSYPIVYRRQDEEWSVFYEGEFRIYEDAVSVLDYLKVFKLIVSCNDMGLDLGNIRFITIGEYMSIKGYEISFNEVTNNDQFAIITQMLNRGKVTTLIPVDSPDDLDISKIHNHHWMFKQTPALSDYEESPIDITGSMRGLILLIRDTCHTGRHYGKDLGCIEIILGLKLQVGELKYLYRMTC